MMQPNPTSVKKTGATIFFFGKYATVMTVVLIGIYIILRLWHLTQYNLGRDEIFTFETVTLGWRDLLAAVAADAVHPPLFYFLLKIWVGWGTSLLWLKLFPTLISIVAIAPFLLLCLELKLRKPVINLAILLMAVNSYLVMYAHELRMYSLLFLVTLLTLWQFARLVNLPVVTRLDVTLLILAHVLLIYTHYYGWLIILTELFFITLWRRDRTRLVVGIVATNVFLFLPWVIVVHSALSRRAVDLGTQLHWHLKPSLTHFAGFYAALLGTLRLPRTTSTGLLVVGLVITWRLWTMVRERRVIETSRLLSSFFLLTFALVPVLLAFGISHLLAQSIWHSRYLIVAAAPYLLLVAWAVSRFRPVPLRVALTVFVVAWATASAVTEIRRTDARIAWDVLAQNMSKSELTPTGPIKVIMLDDFPRYPMTYFLKTSQDTRFQFSRLAVQDLKQLNDDHCWVIYDEGAWAEDLTPSELLQAQGYVTGPILGSGPKGHRYILFRVCRTRT